MSNVSIAHVNPFLKATIETYASMLGTTPKAGKPTLVPGSGVNYDISGIIGIAGGIKGSVAISYPEESAIKSISAFLGEEITSLDNDAMDAIGELANIVAGYAKKFLTEYEIEISLPTVIKGSNLVIKEPPDVFSFIVPFECEHGNFDLSVGLKT